jgi:hypothetical protein
MLRLFRQHDATALQAARALALQFDLYLRPCELMRLSCNAVLLPFVKAGAQYHTAGVVVAPSPSASADSSARPVSSKTGTFDDMMDHASRPLLSRVLKLLVADTRNRRSERVFFLLSYRGYTGLICEAAAQAGVVGRITPHLVRPGGLSEDFFRRACALDEIQKRGRWPR